MISKHEQIKVNKSTIENFLILNDFKLVNKDYVMATKGRLNVSYWDERFSIMGNTYKYPKSLKKVAKIFAKYEPTWKWEYISVLQNEFKTE